MIDEIIEEPAGGAHRHPEKTIELTREAIVRNLKNLKRRKAKRLVETRYNKFCKMGRYKHTRS